MIEMTVQIPNDIATRLAPIQQHLPLLLRQIAHSVPVDRPAEASTVPPTAYPVYNELLDFLVAAPSPQDIANYKVSAAAQARLRQLLEKNQEAALTDDEQAELDAYEQVEQIMTLLKARAFNQIKQ